MNGAIDLTPRWVKKSRATQEWRDAQADYVSEHPDLTAIQAFIKREEAARRMFKVENHYYEKEMAS